MPESSRALIVQGDKASMLDRVRILGHSRVIMPEVLSAPVKDQATIPPAPVEGTAPQSADVKQEAMPMQPEMKKGGFLHRIKSLIARHISGGDQVSHPAESSAAAPESLQPVTTPEAPASQPPSEQKAA